MASRIADDQQTRLSMGTAMQSTAGSALQSLMSKGGKSPAASPKSQGGGRTPGGSPTKAASDQRTVVSSATQLKSTSQAGALLTNLVSPKTKATTLTPEEPVKPTHSDRAREQAEAKVPLLAGPHSNTLAGSPQASLAPHYRPNGQSVSRCDGARILKVVGAICIVTLVVAVAGVVFLVKPQAASGHKTLRKSPPAKADRHATERHTTEAPSTSRHSGEQSTSQVQLRVKHVQRKEASDTKEPVPVVKVEHTTRVHSTEAPSTSTAQTPNTSKAAVHSTRAAEREVSTTTRGASAQEKLAFAQAIQPFLDAPEEVPSQTAVYFDCNDKQGLLLNQWSSEHIHYCCATQKIGCDVVAPNDCSNAEALSEWSSWSDSCTCGGQRHRQRRFRAAYRARCESESRYLHLSDIQPCPQLTMDDFLSSWSSWGHCSVTCGAGRRKRVRSLKPLASQCSLEFPLEERQECKRPDCSHAANDAAQ